MAMSAPGSRNADAIRYVVLRRLAPGMRHAMVGELQSMQFLGELGARLLRTGTDDPRLRDCLGKIPAAAGAAIATCNSMMEWLRPEEGGSAMLADVVAQCVALLSDEWRMRGFLTAVDLPDAAGRAPVPGAAARELVVASLLAVTDLHPGPQDVEVSGLLDGPAVELRLQRRSATRSAALPSLSTRCPLLDGEDVAFLAAAHGVGFSHAHGFLTLRFAVARQTPESPEHDAGPLPR
jgi:hypothetical protein